MTKLQKTKLLNSLSLYALRTCKTLHECCLCEKDITLGQQYRDGGYGRRAHVECIAAEREK